MTPPLTFPVCHFAGGALWPTPSAEYLLETDGTDEQGGQALREHNGPLTHTTSSGGQVGEAVDLDSASSEAYKLTSGDTIPTSSVGAISYWCNSETSINGHQFAYSNSGGTEYWWIGLYASANQFRFRNVADGVSYWNYTVNTSTWYHIVMQWDGASFKVYVNNVDQGSPDFGSAPSAWSAGNSFDRMTVGAYIAGGTIAGYHNGMIDQFRIFDAALSTDEIEALYNE